MADCWTDYGYRLIVVRDGPKGRVVAYERPNGRAPSLQVLAKAPAQVAKRLTRTCNRFAWHGFSIVDNDSFKRNTREGSGLWALKAHDHRIYGFREANLVDGREVLVLLSGWVKDKDFTIEERHQIASAQRLRTEYLALVGLVPHGTVFGTLGPLSESYCPQTIGLRPAPVVPPKVRIVPPQVRPLRETQPLVEQIAPPEDVPPPVPATKEEPMPEVEIKSVPYFHVTKLAEVPYYWARSQCRRKYLSAPRGRPWVCRSGRRRPEWLRLCRGRRPRSPCRRQRRRNP